MPDGFQGPGYIDPVTGEWVPTPGTGLNGIPQATATATPGSPGFATPQGGSLINTPNSSSGQPQFQDPSATGWSAEFAQPQGGQLATRTPNSRTGAPAPGIRNVPGANAATMPGLPMGGALGTALGALIGAPTTNQGIYNNANKVGSAVDNSTIGKWLIDHGITSPSPQWGAASAPVTAPGSGPGRSPPGPPTINLPQFNVPPGNLPPFNRGPIPAAMPQAAVAPRAPASYNLGNGAQTPAAAATPPNPNFAAFDRPNADIVGGSTVPGQLSAAPREPGGPAQMGMLDLSRMFSHPAAAAAHPAVQGALAGGGWQVGAPNMNDAALGQQIMGNGWSGGRAPARAPMVQPGSFGAGTNKYSTPNRWNPFAQFGTPT
jgi:hypothetical protein